MATDDPKFESGGPGDTAAFLGAIRDHGWFVALALCAAAAAVVAYFLVAPKRYEAEADVLVTPISTDDEALKGLGLLSDAEGSVFTTAKLLERPQVTNRVEDRLGLDIPRRELLSKVSITPLPQSTLVTVRATESTPEKAAALANTFAGELIAERSEIFQTRLRATINRLQAEARRSGGGDPATPETDPAQLRLLDRLGTLRSFRGENDPTLEIWSGATAPDTAKPKSPLVLAVIFIAAALLAAGAGLAFEFLSPRIRSRSTLPAGWRVIAVVPSVRRGALVGALAGDGELPESFWDAWRHVRSRLITGLENGESSASVFVTSPSPREGKSEAAACLAVTLAASGTDVVLVDANLREPQVAELFDAGTGPGVAELLQGRVELGEALVPVKGMPGLRLVPAGDSSRDAVDLLEPTAIADVFAGFKREGRLVIIDGPALTTSAEAVALAAAADTVIVCARSGHSRLEKVRELATVLQSLGVPVLGVVLRERHRARGRTITTPRLHAQREPKAAPLRSEVA